MIARRWRQAGPWLVPMIAIVELVLVFTGGISLGAATWTVVAAESLLLATTVSRLAVAARRFRNTRSTGLDRWRAVENGLAELIPQKFAHAILIEPKLVACIGAWVRDAFGEAAGRDESFRYGAQLRLFVGMLVPLVLVEGAVVDFILAVTIPGSPWIWVTLGLHVYGAVWLLGLLASMSTRPHLLTDTSLLIRDSIFNEVSVPYAAIVEVTQTHHLNLGRSGLKLEPDNETATLAYGEANIEIRLDPSVPIGLPRDATSPVRTLHISADEPVAFIRSVLARRTQRLPLR